MNAPRSWYWALLPFLIIGGFIYLGVLIIREFPEYKAIVLEVFRRKPPAPAAEKPKADTPKTTTQEPVIVPPVPVPATRPVTTAIPPKSSPSTFGAPVTKGRFVAYLEYGRQYRNERDSQAIMRREGINVGPDAKDALRNLIIAPIESDGRAIAVSIRPRELGFRKRAPLGEIVKKAEEEGLRAFPIEAVPSFVLWMETSKNRYYFGTQIPGDGHPWEDILAASRYDQTTYLWVMDDNSPDPRPNGLEPDDIVILAR